MAILTFDLRPYHFILSERARLIAEHVLYPAEFLRNGAAPHQGLWDGLVSLDDPTVHHFTHVQVNPQAEYDRYKGKNYLF